MKHLTAAIFVLLGGCASSDEQASDSLTRQMMGQAPRSELTAAQKAEVAKHPLGSLQNPVLAQGPAGEQAYFARLRCQDGKQPFFERGGSVMERSPYGSIMDVYEVVCDSPPRYEVFIDMYHPGYVELRPIPGFTIVAPGEK